MRQGRDQIARAAQAFAEPEANQRACPDGSFGAFELRARLGPAIEHVESLGAEECEKLELLGAGHLDVDGHSRGEVAALLGAIEPHAMVADVEDEGLVDVARLRHRAGIAQLGGNVVSGGAQLMAGEAAVKGGKVEGYVRPALENVEVFAWKQDVKEEKDSPLRLMWEGAVEVVKHCASLGHRRIAHVDGGQGAGADARRRGYEEAMRGLRLAKYLTVVPGSFTEEGGHAGALALLERRPRPTAIFASNDVAAIGAACRERRVPFHVDAAQSVGKVPLDLATLPIDLCSLTAHKVCGPKGVGALYVRPDVRLVPELHGGEQERGLRAGTLATHQIAGMDEAALSFVRYLYKLAE